MDVVGGQVHGGMISADGSFPSIFPIVPAGVLAALGLQLFRALTEDPKSGAPGVMKGKGEEHRVNDTHCVRARLHPDNSAAKVW